jgi:toxin-antitoxin system PIN domain toxin
VGQEKLFFCRISELGFLRLLTNPHVMGSDVLSPAQAWTIYDQWRSDDRIASLAEGTDFNRLWRSSASGIAAGPNAWTDAYLATFAAHSKATVVTLDRKFGPLDSVAIRCLV